MSRCSAVAALMSVASLTAQGWEQLAGPAWSLKFPEVVVDTVRDRLVTVDDLAITWEWDGERWRRMGTARRNGNVVFDAARGRTLRIGFDSTFYYEDWDGHSWTPRSTTTPAPGLAPMVFDPVRNVALMLGVAGLSQWDGNVWTPLGGRPASGWSRLIWDSARQQVLALSHTDIDTPMQTHRWNGSAWQLLGGAGPTNPNFACADDRARGRLVAHGGGSSSTSSTTWEWDGAQWRVIAPSPFARRDHVLAFDPGRGQVVAFAGGAGDGTLGRSRTLQDAWAWNGASWQRIAVWAPGSRLLTAAAYDRARGQFVLFGGRGAGVQDGETWRFDGHRWREAAIGAGPGAREGHAMAESANGDVLLFGGYSTQARGDFWRWDGANWTALGGAAPPARFSHVLALDLARSTVVLHGGSSGPLVPLADTWEWDGATWRMVGNQGPSSSFGSHTGAWSPSAGGIVVSAAPLSSGTFRWDGIAWQPIGAPVPDLVMGLGYDPVTTATVALSRQLNGTLWLWTLAGSTWVAQPALRVPIRGPFDGSSTSLLAWDNRGALLHYGGTFLQHAPIVPAAAVEVGAPCTDAAAATPAITSFGLPRVGEIGLRLDLRGDPAAIGIVGFATRPAVRQFGPGCAWRIDDGPVVLAATDARGNGSVAAPIAVAATLYGVAVHVQAALLAPAAVRGFVFSAPLRLTLGD